MEKLVIIGLAAWLSFFAFGGNKPWVTPPPTPPERIGPGIDKPWVNPPTTPPARIQPAID